MAADDQTRDAATASQRMTHERFAQELMRFARACSRGDAGQALASRSALLLHDKEQQQIIDLCAADTTAADLAQEVEFLKAEIEGLRSC